MHAASVYEMKETSSAGLEFRHFEKNQTQESPKSKRKLKEENSETSWSNSAYKKFCLIPVPGEKVV